MTHTPSPGPIDYNYTVVRQFSIVTILWGIVGMLVGVLIAAQMAWPALNFDIPWLSFGRLRPLHTNAVIFARHVPHRHGPRSGDTPRGPPPC